MWFLYLLIFLLILIFIARKYNNNEAFNEQTGRYCYTCSDKTPNQCLNCFNCGFAIDQFGNSMCLGGDMYGPHNKEKVARWYYGDPFQRTIENNDNYKCSYGPKQMNRIIGI